MKYAGKKIEGANVDFLVLPRPDGNIVFKARAILDMGEFDKLCPEPVAAIIVKRGGKPMADVNNAQYKKMLAEHGSKRFYYIIIKSLEATEELEWETVKIMDPSTWGNYEKELKDSGFSQVEVNRIVGCVLNANSLNEAKLEEARKDFLSGEQHLNGQLFSQVDVASSTLSGEQPSDSD